MPPDAVAGATSQEIVIEVLRYRSEEDWKPVPQGYRVPFTDDMSVLQGLQYIKDHLDGTLSFRWSCRMAICGSCGMMINGKPKLACHDLPARLCIRARCAIEPLAHFPIERDLVVDSRRLRQEARKHQALPDPEDATRGWTRANICRPQRSSSSYEQFSACINCMLCYAACPQFGENPDFIGPGALALLHRYNADSRDGGAGERMDLVHTRGRRLELHRRRLLLRGLSEARRSRQRRQPEQD